MKCSHVKLKYSDWAKSRIRSIQHRHGVPIFSCLSIFGPSEPKQGSLLRELNISTRKVFSRILGVSCIWQQCRNPDHTIKNHYQQGSKYISKRPQINRGLQKCLELRLSQDKPRFWKKSNGLINSPPHLRNLRRVEGVGRQAKPRNQKRKGCHVILYSSWGFERVE